MRNKIQIGPIEISPATALAPMEGITGTATHFVLRKYKDKNTIYHNEKVDERGNCAL